MYAFAMPSSSPAAAAKPATWSFFANSPRIFAERSATSCRTRAEASGSGGCVFESMVSPSGWSKSRHAVGADPARQLAVVVQVVQVRDRLAHGEKNLARIELAAEQQLEDFCRATRRCRARRL